jgi:hypothetical protein
LKLVVSLALKDAIDRAISVAVSAEQGRPEAAGQSLTLFDNPSELRVEISEPNLEKYAAAAVEQGGMPAAWRDRDYHSRSIFGAVVLHRNASRIAATWTSLRPPQERSRDGKINSRKEFGSPCVSPISSGASSRPGRRRGLLSKTCWTTRN